MSLSQPIRTLLLAAVLITAAVVVRHYFESPAAAPVVDEEFVVPPVIRVARENQPTIVESNANWLEEVPPADDRDRPSRLTDPQGPDLLQATPLPDRRSDAGSLLR